MSAPQGNKNGEKYSKEVATKLFQDSLALVQEDDTIKFIGTLAVKMNIYRQLYDYLIDRFFELDTIKRKIDAILESRVVEMVLNNKGNPTFAIFHLKNNHNWADKTEVEHSQKIISFERAKDRKGKVISN